VIVDGKNKQVPSFIGIDPASGKIAALHTHDSSGLVHLESAKENEDAPAETLEDDGAIRAPTRRRVEGAYEAWLASQVVVAAASRQVARCRGVPGARARSARPLDAARRVRQGDFMDKRPALGKGLSALIPDVPEPRVGPLEVEIDRLSPNKFQPRAQVDDQRLEELAKSIRSNGVIQPIVVRKSGDRFQIIAGERRWRAARKAGLMRVPIVVREVEAGDQRALLEMALIENVQRENLNPIDEAQAYRRLSEEFHLTQEDIASRVGKDRASVANFVRLLKLPVEVQGEVAAGTLSMGHARALVGLTAEADQRRLAREVVARNLSVRETEALVKKIVDEGRSHVDPPPQVAKPVDVHTRSRRPAPSHPRDACAHRPARHEGPDRDRLRL
jgi:ParB family chromosome partitioning protein